MNVHNHWAILKSSYGTRNFRRAFSYRPHHKKLIKPGHSGKSLDNFSLLSESFLCSSVPMLEVDVLLANPLADLIIDFSYCISKFK